MTTQPESGTPAETSETYEGCDCTELCSMGPTCPGAVNVPGAGCWRTRPDALTMSGLKAALAELNTTPAAPSHPEGETVEGLAEALRKSFQHVLWLGSRDLDSSKWYADELSRIAVREIRGLVVTEDAARAREASAVEACVAIHEGIRAQAVREAAAGALRSAADAVDLNATVWDHDRDVMTNRWLRDRADTIDGSA